MNKNKVLEASLEALIVALSEETDRFVRNKQHVHSLVADVLRGPLNDRAAASES